MNIIALPAFADNYIWMLHNTKHAIVVDPGDATPVIAALQYHQLELAAILITHHHTDHTAGIGALRPYLQKNHASQPNNLIGKVWAPATEAIPEPFEPLGANQQLELLGLKIKVLDVPGHTAGHIAYYMPAQALPQGEVFEPAVFTGDTLFSAGCGRLFEGTPAQMLASLDQLAALPAQTRVYPAHEYTLANLRFAQAVEPGNEDVAAYTKQCQELRAQNRPTLPTQLAQELRINPFLRTRSSVIMEAVQKTDPGAVDEVSVFAALRHWKDTFK